MTFPLIIDRPRSMRVQPPCKRKNRRASPASRKVASLPAPPMVIVLLPHVTSLAHAYVPAHSLNS